MRGEPFRGSGRFGCGVFCAAGKPDGFGWGYGVWMRGDEDFEAAFDQMLGRAYRHALRLVGDRVLAEDLAAEAVTRAYVRWRRVRVVEYRDAWVLRVVTNLAIDAFAKRHVSPDVVVPLGLEDA